jgi:hypothetical protein
MSTIIPRAAVALSVALAASAFAASVPASAQVRGATTGVVRTPAAATADVSAAPLSPKARGELAHRFVTRWGHYVERVYQVPVGVWAKRMVPNFVAADPANFRRALTRDTFEAAVADLGGSGHRVGDDRVIDRLAKVSGRQGGHLTVADMKALGSLSGDLTYTPITPCRIVDTRVAGGVIAANSTRSFKAVNSANYTAQGGSATDCGLLGVNASAVAVNITAVTPAVAGFATVYPFGTSQPLASSVNYTAGAIVNNAIVSAIPNPLQSSDFTVFTFAQSHYVIDIVGYFAPPVATALECTETFTSQTIAANGTFDIDLPNCPTGYTITGAGCRTPGFDQANFAINGLYRPSAGVMDAFCSGLNKTAGSITVEGTVRCCRVPGR